MASALRRPGDVCYCVSVYVFDVCIYVDVYELLHNVSALLMTKKTHYFRTLYLMFACASCMILLTPRLGEK
jgi:hypothetical protein